MDCADNSETPPGTSSPSRLSYPVPFGHVPYCPALPGAMGILNDFPVEWWYFGGWAEAALDKSDRNKQFTLFFQTIRFRKDALVVYGIGDHECFSSYCPPCLGSLDIPSPSTTSWSLSANAGGVKMSCKLHSGTLGLPGAKYVVEISDHSKGISAVFCTTDNFGMIFELASGACSDNSFEFAMPSLTIESGKIDIQGEKFEIRSGNLWLDRQTLSIVSPHDSESFLKSFSKSKELYTGNWLAVVMLDQTVFVLVFYWKKKKDQWISGNAVGFPPLGTIGLEYPPLPQWDHKFPVQGVNVLKSNEFDLNIFDHGNPPKSPHWKSPTSQQTYCSKWILTIKKEEYTMTALVPGSEVNVLNESFFEGAATIADANGHIKGYAMVEQMGYTQ